MNINPVVSAIKIFPIKSLDGINLTRATIGGGGSFEYDREFAMVDDNNNFIIGKTNPKIHLIRTQFDLDNNLVQLKLPGVTSWQEFNLHSQTDNINDYLTAFFGFNVRLIQNSSGRFMDMPDESSFTVVSTSTLEKVASWFEDTTAAEIRRRFRTTLELSGTPPFWEDHLFSSRGTDISFCIGEVQLFGKGPRARCIVPTRDSYSGQGNRMFAKDFSRHRASELPEFSKLAEYDHNYFLTVNCAVATSSIGKTISVGDALKLNTVL